MTYRKSRMQRALRRATSPLMVTGLLAVPCLGLAASYGLTPVLLQIPSSASAAERARLALPSAELKVIRLLQQDGQWTAEVAAPSEPTKLILRAGDRLKDGVVKSVSKDHIMVEMAVADELSPSPRLLLRFSPPRGLPPITLGRDTTWITSPLLADGGPDYGVWLNEMYGAGVTPENNAAGPIRAAHAGMIDAGQTFWDGIPLEGGFSRRLLSKPWFEKDCPRCVARLKLNEKALDAVAEAARRPRYFVARPTGSRNADLPSLLGYRLAANALSGRGMLRVGSGDLEGAGADAQTLLRLAVVLDRGALIHRLMAAALRGMTAPLLPALASAPSLGAGNAQRFLRQFTALPSTPSLAEAVDLSERGEDLDRVLFWRAKVSERGAGGMLEDWADYHQDPIVTIRYALAPESFDWNSALRDVNQGLELIAAFLRASSPSERQLARATLEAAQASRENQLANLKKDLRSRIRDEATELQDMAAAADEIARTPEGRQRLAVLFPPFYDVLVRAQVSVDASETLFRIGVMTLALAAHRHSTGHFPVTLKELAADLLPDRLAPSTPLPGYTLRYSQTAGTGGAPGTFAIVAKPEEQGVRAFRAFCVDSTGAMRFTLEGIEPKLVDGVCDPAMGGVN